MHAWDKIDSYSQHSSRWFEPASLRDAGVEHLAAFRAVMPASWRLRRSGLWLVAEPPDSDIPPQGWKLHVSACAERSVEVLRAVLPVLRDRTAVHKFLLDSACVSQTTGKLWPRGSSGKFITVYPSDDTEFMALSRELTAALDGFDGPYILSDKRCPGSRVVYYRYGGFASIPSLRSDGIQQLNVVTPGGVLVADDRLPYWHVPEWASDPFETKDSPDGDLLLGGRFTVEEAITFSNRGGVYRGTDRETGVPVIIKEARPYVRMSRGGVDAIDVLAREHRLLTRLADTGYFPRPLAFVREWEHAFLVESVIDGDKLSTDSISANPLITLEPDGEATRAYFLRMRSLWRQIAEAIAAAHECGVLLGDLSFTNILVTDDGQARVIDLDGGLEIGVDDYLGLYTPGLSSPRAVREFDYTRADDYYTLGALIFGCLMVVNTAVAAEPALIPRFLGAVCADLAVPAELPALITDLMSLGTSTPDAVLIQKRISELPFGDHTAWSKPIPAGWQFNSAQVRDEAAETVAGVTRYLREVASPQRSDRLFPADLTVFETNPLAPAHGATGVLRTLHQVTGARPEQRFLSWVLGQDFDADRVPPGLYVGQSGIAWSLADLGYQEVAERLQDSAAEHPLLWQATGLYSGCAGVGLAALRLWQCSGQDRFLDTAIRIGERLRSTARPSPAGPHWPDTDGKVPIGYAHGASGIALFLLYMSLVADDPSWCEFGRAALGFDLAQRRRYNDYVVAFPERIDSQADDEQERQTLRAYWDAGTAGVITSSLRYHIATADDELVALLPQLLPDICRKYAVMPQKSHGLAGLGQAVLDAHEFTGDYQWLTAAERTAAGVLLFRFDRPEGTAYLGEQSLRESADLATGAAGVAQFLHRLPVAKPGGRSNPDFLLDDLLPAGTRSLRM
ncbi:class III lanthionine synthetase LanKC [Nocardia sp. NPDC088792]|uniref:class III lanthionine synthetase LanKC n=1 Tax=Nocardia sp. NPDC088792 TaxID=3364332 RepID=UPI00381E8DEA